MKVTLETDALINRGVILESENSEEKQILRNIWEQKGGVVCMAKVGHDIEGNLQITIAPRADYKQ